MRTFTVAIAIFMSNLSFSQVTTTKQEIIVDSGKYEFKLQSKKDNSDYSDAFRILSEQVKLNPKNAELRYFLGYTIDRLNASDGREMVQLTREMTIKASEQFEEVNRLEPVYKGEIFILDPYAKITSIWGCLAQAYLNRKRVDSAKWAFEEGKRRGGFIEPVLDFNRQLLNSCDQNAILVTYGDSYTIPIWYLQTIENYRNDIIVVDANLINANWYPKYLKAYKGLKMSYSDQTIDTIEYKQWSSQDVTVVNARDTTKKFSWELRPTYMDKYILKGDRILLDIIQQNIFDKPFYFSSYPDSTYDLFLTPHLVDNGLVTRVIPEFIDWKSNVLTIHKNLDGYNIEKVQVEELVKSRDAVIVLNGFRWCYYNIIYQLIKHSQFDKAQLLIRQMNDRFKMEKLPFASKEDQQYFEELFKQAYRN